VAVDAVLPDIHVLSIDSVEELASRLPREKKYFALLLAWDAPEIGRDSLAELFAPLVSCGLAYFCAWGSRCEEVHDAVDDCFVVQEMENGEADPFLMTTWHRDESLEEALWFFKMLAVPAESSVLADLERFAVAVGNPQWASDMAANLSKTDLH
jgi:hypothetical protein